MKMREGFSWGGAIVGWALSSLIALYMALCAFVAVVGPGGAPLMIRLLMGLLAIGAASLGVFTVKQSWEDLCPWVFKPVPTSKSSLQNLVPSNFQSASQPPSNPPSSPSKSRSLPSVTIDQPVVGFRDWHTAGPADLRPLVRDEAPPWSNVTTATCAAGKNHSAPAEKCSCGLYAYFVPQQPRWPSSGTITGVVLGSGRIYRHPAEGFRAERMRILAFSRPQLAESRFEVCPKMPTLWLSGGYNTADVPRDAPGIRDQNGEYMRFGHGWETEDRALELPAGKHRFQIKVKCRLCGCGPEREFITVNHDAEVKRLEAIAESFGVPVIPAEKLAAYAAEFGVIPTEVRALGV